MLMPLDSDASEATAPRGGITEIRITSIQPVFGGVSFGSVGAYEILSGRAFGTIDPKAPASDQSRFGTARCWRAHQLQHGYRHPSPDERCSWQWSNFL